MSEIVLNNNRPRWSRLDLIWSLVWALTFFVALISSLRRATNQDAFEIGLLAGTMIVTHAIVIWIKYQDVQIRDDAVVKGGLFTIQVILWVALVLSSPFWLIHLFSVLAQVHINLERRYALALDMPLFLGVLLQQIEFFGFTLLNLLIWVSASIVAYVFGLWIYNIISDSEEKRKLIDELQRTQAELVSVERREGVLEERGRLARDIHDTLAQGYIGVIMHLEAADEVRQDDELKASFHLNQAEEMAREGLKQARQVVNDLRPDILEDSQGLADALRTLLTRWSAQSDILADLNESGMPVPIHPETELTLLRMTQEGLSNILRHAQATAVQVTISWIGDQLVLDIEDNGVGFDIEAESEDLTPNNNDGGFGLTSMRDRVVSSGGELHIESVPYEGTTLTAILPIIGD
ncbi:MAG: signal transduction histidine kinase [Cellvibrionaceae bacterium]|jgi:signal transduction histidine kinase